jgi:hypothetical protein
MRGRLPSGTGAIYDSLEKLADISLDSGDNGSILVYTDGVWVSRDAISGGTP